MRCPQFRKDRAINRLENWMPSNIIAVTSADSFTVKGLKFRTVRSNYQAHTTSADEIIILKDPEFLEILILYPSWRGLIKRMDILSHVAHVYRGEQQIGQFTVD
jgi:hypothetical protein